MIIATKKKKKETSKEEDKNNTWVKATEDTKKIKEVWSDGYDFGDVTKTILGVSKIAKDTTKDALVNIGKGFMSTVEGSVDSIRYGMSDLYRKSAEKNPDQTIMTGGIVLGKPQQISDTLKQNAQYEVTKNLLGEENDIFKENWSAKVDEKSVLGNKSDSIFQGVGNVGAFVGMSQLTGGSNVSTFLNSFSSAYGNARTEAYKQGADDKTANRAGWISGLAEGISEQFFSGIPGMKTAGWGDALNSRLSKAIQKYLGSAAGKVALTFFDGLGEGSEEVISNMLNATFTDIMHYLDNNYTYGMENMSGNISEDVFNSAFSQDSLDSFIYAMFTSLLTGGGKQIIQNQSNARTSNKVAKQSDMSKSQANEIMEKIAERRANLTLEEDANYKERTEAIESARQQLNKEIRQQIKQGNTVDLNELFNQTPADNTQAQFTFNNDEIKNVRTDKQNVLANDMAKLNNVKSNHDLYRTINAIQSANNTQQYHITTTEGLYNMGIVDKTADGKYVMKDGSPYVPRGLNYKDGDIYINADVGSQSGTQAVYHEMFESFKKASPNEYKQFKQMVKDIVGEESIQESIQEYTKMYGEELTDNIEDEIINDKFGELAESQDFINRISDNRTLLQKFIDTVKNMINYVKGTEEERKLIKLQKELEKQFAKRYKETDFSQGEGDTAYSLKESKAMLEKQFKDLTGDSLLVAEAKLGNYAFQQIRGNQVEAPYNQEAMDLLEKIQNSKKTSSHLYHSTPADRIQSIAKNGLVVGSKQNQEGVSSTNKLYLSATEELADSFTPENSVMLRISPNAKLENLDNDLLGGEGSYTITNNIEPKYLQVKENGKWIPLLKSKYANDTKYSLSKDNGIQTINDYLNLNNYTFNNNGVLTVNNLTDRQIKDLVKIYHTTGYEDVSTDYLVNRLKEGNMPLQREVADRFIEKELGYKPTIDTTQVFEDAEGNPLTKEQIEFYKDSAVRDIRGRLIPVYHRTNAEFTEFDSKAGTQHGKKYGKGFYFSTTPENYGNNTMKLYLNAKEGEFKYVPKMGYYIVQNPNQIKNVDNKTPTSSNDIRYSLATNKDSEGRTLSKEQQEYFKDSKVVDENGNLKVMYHGTPNNNFYVFENQKVGTGAGLLGGTQKGFYFTDSKLSAEGYAAVKGINDNMGVKEVYLNMKNPLIVDTTTEEGKQTIRDAFGLRKNAKITTYYIDNYINKKLYNDAYGIVSEERRNDFFNSTGYDGVININDIGDNEYVVFNSNQIKNIDNTNPTSNEDIRYSLAPTGEMVDNKGNKVEFEVSEVDTQLPISDDKKLMVLHNLGENKMNGIMDLDGIPVPSLAITNPNKVDHSGFGEATLIFKKDTIDPANRLNEVYDRDVWSPTQPQIDYDIKFDDLMDLEDKIYNKHDAIAGTALNRYFDRENLSDNVDRYGIEGTIEEAKNSDELKYIYYKTMNPDFEILKKTDTEDLSSRYSNELLQEFNTQYGKEIPNWMNISDEQRKEVINDFRNYWKPILEARRDEIIAEENAKPEPKRFIIGMAESSVDNNLEWLDSLGGQDKLIEHLHEIQNNGGTREVNDIEGTKEFVNNNINQEEYNKWVDDTLGNLLRTAEKGIYNGKDYITANGRRTFKQLHDKYTLENLVKALTKGDTKGTQQTMVTGYGQIQAQLANQFNSIEEIRNAENQIMSDEEAKALTEQLHNAINEDIDALADRLDGDYFNMNNASEMIFEYAGKKNRNEETFRKIAKDYANHGIPSELIQKITNDLEQLKNMPTDYFEAKPQRAVGLDEIGIGLIPTTWSDETKQRMRDKGIKFIEYDKSIEGERQRLEKELTDFMFSLTSNQNIDSKEIAPIREDLSNLSNQLNNLSNQIQTLQNGLETQPSGYVETYNEQRNENIPTRNLTEEDANTLQDALMQDEGYLRSLDEQANMNTENTKLIDRLTNNVTQRLDLDKSQKETLKGIVKESIENGYSADEISQALQKEFSEMSYEMTNQEAVDARKLIRDIPIKVSDAIKTDIADYGKWKSSNFGKINFSNSGSPVDSVYAELSNRMPYFFPSDISNPTDQLLKIAEVANMATKVTETIDIDPSEFDNIADYIKNTTLEDQYNAQMNSQYDLDKNIQFDMAEDIAPTTIRTQESIDDYIENRDIAPVREDMGTRRNNSPLRDRLETIRRRFGEMITNRNYVIDETAKATGNRQIKFAGDMLNSVSGEAQYNINNKQTDMNGNVIGKSVTEIFEPSKKAGLYEAFNDYLVQKSNIERHRVGKGSQVPEAVSQQLVKMYETENPQFKEWAKDVYKYFDNVLQEQVDAGLITQEQFNNYRGEEGIYRSYVPFYEGEIDTNRFFDNEGKVKPVSTLKRSTGNATDVNQLLAVEDSMAKQTYAYKRAIRQNELYKEIVNSLDKYSDAMDMDLRDNPTNLDDVLYTTPDGDKILSAYVDGEKMSAKISDELYNELSGDNEARIKQLEDDFSLITKPLQKVSNVRRNILTSWNPTFLARNAIKDIQDAVINSKHTGDMLKNYFGLKQGQKSAVFELREGKTKEAQQFLALYGADNLYGDYSNVGQKKGLINKFARANELIELAPRFAEFKASLQNGESVQEAIYNAREVTTNFGRGGYITKALNRNGFTFLNANVQGLNKLVRNLSGENGVKGVTSVVVKGAVFAVLPSILNELLYGAGDDKDEEYEALPDYIKDNYYLIKTEGNKFVRIPKGRINAAFGSLARRTVNAIEGDENAYEGALSNAWDQIGVGDLGGNNILAPMIQAFGSQNGEAWYGGDIVPTRLQNKPASEQTDAKIDAISNAIGELFGVSPYKVNYVLDQYTGGAGDILLPMITPETKSGAEKPHEYLLAPIKDAFVVNSTDDNKYAGEFYTAKDKAQIQSNSQYATDEDKLRYKYMSNISSQMSELYKERREVQADTTLGNKEKYAKVQAIQNEINNLAKEGLNNYDNFNNTENYSNIGDTEYYKNAEGEWTKVSDDEQEFTAGLNDAEKTAYYNVKNKINGITQDYTAKTKDLDKNDSKKAQYSAERKENITQTIVNSGLDNNTKAMIYSKYYSNKDTMNNVVNAGYNIDTYITALNDIEQIRNKYSQKNGYSTEERKQRTIAYINSLEMEIPQKAMMIRQYYTSFREYNNDIVNFVGNLNIPYEDKKAILEGTGMTVNGNNVSWK